MKSVVDPWMRWTSRGLVLLVCAGLAVDVWVHLDVAASYALVRTSLVSQATLFRVEAIAAAISALFLITRPGRFSAAIAFLVSGGGAGLVLLYTYVDMGALGPLPDMYEPVWYTEKLVSFYAEAGAAAASLGIVLLRRPPRLTGS